MKMRSSKSYLIAICISLILLGGFLYMTNPNDLALGFLIIPLFLIACISYFIAGLLLSALKIFEGAKRYQLMVKIIFPLFITGSIVFQSIGGLNAREIILLVGFCVVSVFYLVKLI